MRSRTLRLDSPLHCAMFCVFLAFCLRISNSQAEPQEKITLVERLASEKFSQRTSATYELHRLGLSAIPLLIEGVKHHDVEVRRRALIILGDLAASHDTTDAPAVVAALARLAGEDSTAAEYAAEALTAVREELSQGAIRELQYYGAIVQWQNSAAQQGLTVSFGSKWKGGESRVELLNRLNDLQMVSLENSRLGDSVLRTIGRLPELRRLYLGGGALSGKGLAELGGLQQLEHLSLRNESVTDAAFAELPPLRSLQSLGLDGTHISNNSLKHLARYPDLRTLWLDRTEITAEGLTELQPLANLAVLYLSETNISGDGLAALKKLPSLRNVSLKRCQLATEDMALLSGLENLEMLGFDHTSVGDEHLALLDNLPKLRVLWLSGCKDVTDASLERIGQFQSLQTLYLHASSISEAGAAKLRKTLPQCQVYH